ACGTGVFLLAVLDYLRRRSTDTEGHTACGYWNNVVPRLLSRLIGIEILPAAALIAKLNIALTLSETGYDFTRGGNVRIVTADALVADTQSKIQSAIGGPKS